MSLGDTVYLRGYSNVIGEVVSIDDNDMVTVFLFDAKIRIIVDIQDLMVLKAGEWY